MVSVLVLVKLQREKKRSFAKITRGEGVSTFRRLWKIGSVWMLEADDYPT